MSIREPYLRPDHLAFDLVTDSIKYPWDKKNAFFKLFHHMACRSSTSPTWTTEKGIAHELKKAYARLAASISDGIKVVAYKTTTPKVREPETGEHAVWKEFKPMSQCLAWVWRQQTTEEDEDDDTKPRAKAGRGSDQGLAWLQRRFLLVLQGFFFVYESHVFNQRIAKANRAGTSASEVKKMENELLNSTTIRSYIAEKIRVNHRSTQGALAAPKEKKAIKGKGKEKEQGQLEAAEGSVVLRESERQAAARRDEPAVLKKVKATIADMRKKAIQALTLFLTFGTAGLFHAWPQYKPIHNSTCAQVLQVMSILCDRKLSEINSKAHVYGQRAWSGLDNHMFKILKEFVGEDGRFNEDIRWLEVTQNFQVQFEIKKLAHLFLMDVYPEVCPPLGESVSITGGTAPGVVEAPTKTWEVVAPGTKVVREAFGAQPDPPIVPVKNRGLGLYEGVRPDSGVLTRPENPISRMTEREKAAAAADKELRVKKLIDGIEADGSGKGKDKVIDVDEDGVEGRSTRSSGEESEEEEEGEEEEEEGEEGEDESEESEDEDDESDESEESEESE